MKNCAKCKEDKPRAAFYLLQPTSVNPKPRLHSYCKPCGKAELRAWADENPRYKWARRTIWGHIQRGFVVEFDYRWLMLEAEKTECCPWCKMQIVFGQNRRNHNSPSLDVVDRTKNMTQENVKIVCWRCNAAKGTDSLEGYLSWLHQDRGSHGA